jgi:hypothetical protein
MPKQAQEEPPGRRLRAWLQRRLAEELAGARYGVWGGARTRSGRRGRLGNVRFRPSYGAAWKPFCAHSDAFRIEFSLYQI